MTQMDCQTSSRCENCPGCDWCGCHTGQCGKGLYVCPACLDGSILDQIEQLGSDECVPLPSETFVASFEEPMGDYQGFLARLTPARRAEWDRCVALFAEKFGPQDG